MIEARQNKAVSSRYVTVTWLLLLLGALAHVPLVLTEIGLILQPALFDFILPAIVLFGLIQNWIVLPSRTALACAFGVVATIPLHSVGAWFFFSDIFEPNLVKETLKLSAICVNFFLLLLLFENPAFRQPPKTVVLFVLVGFIPIVLLISFYEPIFVTRTVYAVSLSGLVFLLAMSFGWRNSPFGRFELAFACLAIIGTATVLHNKGVAGLMIATLFWVVFEGRFSIHSVPRIFLIFALAVIAFLIGAASIAVIGANVEFLQNMDSLERSINIRLTLWTLAFERLLETFPIGLGLGQFSVAAKSVPVLAVEGHKFVHNSFLGLMVELGALGMVFSAGIIALIACAVKGLPRFVAPIFLLLVFPPLFIHDGHSIRMLLIVTALGFSRYLYAGRNVEVGGTEA